MNDNYKMTNEIKKILKHTKNMNILYIEDNKEVQFSTNIMFNNFFRKVDLANDGEVGLKLFYKNKNKYDIVFSDIEMPKLDGISMCKKIRKTNTKIPIILLSAYDEKKYLLDGIKCNIFDYILKPYTLETIVDLMKKVINELECDSFIKLVDNYKWNCINNQLYKNSQEIELTKNERFFLKTLIKAKGTICTSDTLEDEIFDNCNYDNKRIRNIVTKLKNKLDVSLVKSIYGEGYKIILLEETIEV